MKRICALLLGFALLVLSATPAWAIKSFSDAFKEIYAPPGTPMAAKVTAANCNVCHGKDAAGKDDKKVRNEYGKAVARHLKKADFTGAAAKLDPKTEAGQKAIADGLAKAAAEKSSSGKTFGDLIKAGELPAKE